MRDLAGRRALLTGASSGLGPVIARRLRREGVRFVLSARGRPGLEALAAELGDAQVAVADLTERGDVERLAGEAGPVDILIANAGVPANGRLLDFEIEHIDRAIDVNLRAVVVLTRLLLPAMVARGSGHVLLMASMAGWIPTAGSSLYNATKFAIRGFGHALRAELRGTGVGVSLVSPTFVSGAGMWAETGLRASVRETTPELVAEACLRAIRDDRAELAVAPPEQRLVGRLALAFPDLVQPLLRSAAVPDAAIERQRAKR
ncbi:MAG TPA: SDR family NAD(P)-dependent oxidoreductase [Chloroflexota bacterium]